MSVEEYRERRYRSNKTREERRLVRQINLYAALTAVIMVVLAYMALAATFGW